MAACVSVSKESAAVQMTAEGLFLRRAVLLAQNTKCDEGYKNNPHKSFKQVLDSLCLPQPQISSV